MKKITLNVFVVILSLLVCTHVYGQNQTSISKEIDDLLSNYSSPEKPGISISITKNSELIYHTGVGISNLEYGIEIDSLTVFHVASVSKQFTAFLIMLLEEEGKLSLDDDVSKYIPELQIGGETITIRQLANHTSGLRGFFDLASMQGFDFIDPLSNQEAVDLILAQKGLNFKPGSEFTYCNSGYVLLGEIVKRVSGMSLAAFAKERIFDPLGMNNTSFLDDPSRIVPNKAYSYRPTQEGYQKELLNMSVVGSTGLNSSSSDLSKWAANFETLKIGSRAIFDEMEAPSVLNDGSIIPYGLGLESKMYKGVKVIFHGGGDAGYRAYQLRCPEYGFSITVLGNDRGFNPLKLCYAVLDLFIEEKEESEPSKNISTMDSLSLLKYEGVYQIFPGLFLEFKVKGDTLMMSDAHSDYFIPLPYLGGNDFEYIYIQESKIVFSEITNGQAEEATWHMSDFSYPGPRVELEDINEDEIDASDYVGRYYSEEVSTYYDFYVDGEGRLVAKHTFNGEILFKAFQEDFFISQVGFASAAKFIRSEDGVVEACEISAQNASNILFKKIKI